MRKLEELCCPLISYMCEIWAFKQRGSEPDLNTVTNDINIMLNKIKETCYQQPMLAQEFSYIEKPLIFFIDYTIKEGGFSFSKEWKNLSRKYEELSGDDKFFDILELNLNDPMGAERVELFYLFMGLGFSGRLKGHTNEIERKMKECLVKMPNTFDANKQHLSSDEQLRPKMLKKAQKKTFSFALPYALAAVFMVAAIGVNHYFFTKSVTPIEQSIKNAILSATQNFAQANNKAEEEPQ